MTRSLSSSAMAPRLRRRKETEDEDAALLKLGSGAHYLSVFVFVVEHPIQSLITLVVCSSLKSSTY